ncbi:MAG TPA: hypothetical protein PKG52_10240 [bacterium]|nr:hypothetical protein [bacterium]HPS30254.1 hypothetical protein [bacterium]
MESLKTKIYSSFDPVESAFLHDFKKEAFHFTGEDVKNFNFWQQYFNLFFIYHYNVGEGVTLAKKRDLEKASVRLFAPARFSKLKGEDFFSGEKLVLSQDEENSLTWYKERDFILSFFYDRPDGIHFVESRSCILIQMNAIEFFKKLKLLVDEKNIVPSVSYALFLVSILMLKKERFSSSKLYDPYQIAEIEKLHLYYEKFSELLI